MSSRVSTPSQRLGPIRSWLFTPANRPDRFGGAAKVGADVLLLDLEDSVPPEQKAQARGQAIGRLSDRASAPPLTAVRINPLNRLEGVEDLSALLASDAEPDFIVMPKAQSASVLTTVADLLAGAGKPARLVPLIESSAGLKHADELAATPAVSALMFGAADMAADLGCAIAWAPLVFARGALLAAAARAGKPVVDSPFFDIADIAGHVAEARLAAEFGFTGKAAVHPKQVAAIADAFTPTPQAVQHARAVLHTAAEGVGTLDGKMIDEAMARQARRILAAAP